MKDTSVSRRIPQKNTKALDGTEDYLVSERVYKFVGTRMIDFRNQLMKTASPKNLKQLLKIKTPPKGVKRKDAEGSAATFDEGDDLLDCEGKEIEKCPVHSEIGPIVFRRPLLLLIIIIIIIIIINFFYISNHINIFYKIFILQ